MNFCFLRVTRLTPPRPRGRGRRRPPGGGGDNSGKTSIIEKMKVQKHPSHPIPSPHEHKKRKHPKFPLPQVGTFSQGICPHNKTRTVDETRFHPARAKHSERAHTQRTWALTHAVGLFRSHNLTTHPTATHRNAPKKLCATTNRCKGAARRARARAR